jgi:hypothetical protein
VVEEKYGKKAARTPWRKMHLAIDPDMNIHAIEITGTEVSDSEGMDRILPTDLPIDRVIADGAYYARRKSLWDSIERGEALNDRGIVAVIPPPSNAVVRGDENAKLHDQTVQYILDKAAFMRFTKSIKRCIGAKLLTQKLESQKCEGVVIANIINLWNSFGRPVSVKNA